MPHCMVSFNSQISSFLSIQKQSAAPPPPKKPQSAHGDTSVSENLTTMKNTSFFLLEGFVSKTRQLTYPQTLSGLLKTIMCALLGIAIHIANMGLHLAP